MFVFVTQLQLNGLPRVYDTQKHNVRAYFKIQVRFFLGENIL